jgi:hypothetical protein
VPDKTPLPAEVVTLKPGGKVPVEPQVYGAVPPVAENVWVYGVPTMPVLLADGVIAKLTGAALVVKLLLMVEDPAAFVTTKR